MKILAKNLLAVITALFVTAAYAWPIRTVTLVLPYSPGGGTDTLARSLQDRLGKELGQLVVIEYKPGGGGAVAINHVVNSRDDHKLLFSTTDVVVTASAVNPNFRTKDLAVVSTLTRSTLVLATRPTGPYADFKTLLNKPPDRVVSFGSPGVGSISHLVLEKMLPSRLPTAVVVHYKGGSPMATDTIGGHNDLSISSYGGTHQPFIESGRLTAVVAFGDTRLPQLPAVPTAKELGIDIVASVSNMVFVHKTLSELQISKLNRAFATAINEPVVRSQLTERGNEVLAFSVDDSQRFLDQEIATWSRYVQEVYQKNNK